MSLKSFLPGAAWFIISFFLLTLPGDDFPHSNFFDIPFFDKYVHFTMFFLLTALFSFPFFYHKATGNIIRAWFARIAALVILYGIAMEFVQKMLSNGRSFDLIDMVFDSLGGIAAFIAITAYHRNKIGPNRNRGRNQN
jgi:cation transport ATPase